MNCKAYFFKISVRLALLCYLFGSGHAYAGPDEGWRLRKFLAEIISAANPNEANAQQAEQMRGSVAKYSDLLPLVFQDDGVRKLVVDANLLGSIKAVESNEEFAIYLQKILEEQVENWLVSWAATNKLPEGDVADLVKNLVPKISEKIPTSVLEQAAKKFADSPMETRMKLLNLVSDDFIRSAVIELNQEIEKVKISESPSLAVLAQQSDTGTEVAGMTREEAQLIKSSLLAYFDHLPLGSKQKIIIGWLQLSPDATLEKQLGVVLNKAGPVLQKMFQLFGRDSPDPKVKAIMAELLANVEPFSTEQAKNIIEKSLGQPIAVLFSSFEEKPLAAGTVGQVYRGVARATNKPVIIKVLRPGIDAEMQSEFKIFRDLVKDNSMALQLIDRLQNNFTEELDFTTEAKHIEEMKVYRSKRLGISTPSLVAGFQPSKSVLVMDLAPGKPISKVKIAPSKKGQAIYNVLKRWFDEVMFGSGYFHGDMHPGNIMYQEAPNEKNGFLVTVIDPGSSGFLSLEKRRGFMRFKLAVLSEDVSETVKSLSAFGQVPDTKVEFLESEVSKIFKNLPAGQDPTNEILALAVREGLQIDSEIVMFSRAIMFLEKELANVNAEILEKDAGAKIFRAENAYMLATLKHLGGQLPKQIFNPSLESEAVIDTSQIRKYLVAQLVKGIRQVVKSCADFFQGISSNPVEAH